MAEQALLRSSELPVPATSYRQPTEKILDRYPLKPSAGRGSSAPDDSLPPSRVTLTSPGLFSWSPECCERISEKMDNRRGRRCGEVEPWLSCRGFRLEPRPVITAALGKTSQTGDQRESRVRDRARQLIHTQCRQPDVRDLRADARTWLIHQQTLLASWSVGESTISPAGRPWMRLPSSVSELVSSR